MVFAGCTEMLRFCVGSKKAAQILYSGALYAAEQVKELGIVDEVSSGEELLAEAARVASDLGNKPFCSIKFLLRKPVAEAMR